jgi:hypothetical protein
VSCRARNSQQQHGLAAALVRHQHRHLEQPSACSGDCATSVCGNMYRRAAKSTTVASCGKTRHRQQQQQCMTGAASLCW